MKIQIQQLKPLQNLQVSKRTIERELAKLQKAGIIRHEGKVNAGIWIILEPQKG